MTHAELVEALGVPSRTLHRYKKKPEWPKDGSLEDMQDFVDTVRGEVKRGRGAAADGGRAKPTGTLQARKLEQEVLKLELANGQRTAAILAEAKGELKEEARRFLQGFGLQFGDWAEANKLSSKMRRELNEIVERSMAALNEAGPVE